jgi:hypothetical protein
MLEWVLLIQGGGDSGDAVAGSSANEQDGATGAGNRGEV